MTAAAADRRLWLATPEGVPVAVELAGVGERFAAFIVDALIIALASFLVVLLAALAGSLWLLALALPSLFMLRVFYFAGLEARPHGRTPGKRWMGLRVVRADGGPMPIESVLTRNFTRELEVFLPLQVLLAPEALWPGHTGVARLLASLWMLAVATLPLWSRSRLRLGDLVAGTRVVRTPRAVLLGDLANRGARRESGGGGAQLAFTAMQLDVYGVYELQVLEDVLRRSAQPGGRDAVAAVSRRIQKKIGWQPADRGSPEPREFLESFYAAQRRHLEQQLQFGKRKERKRQ